jgi:hypothetical protein
MSQGWRVSNRGVIDRVDHLVYGAPDLDEAVSALEGLLGVRASVGGRHPEEGTRNALIALGPASYLEVLAPDPEGPVPAGARWFGIDGLRAPKLVGWAAKGERLETLAGLGLGPVRRASRVRPDGVTLSWSLTDPRVVLEQGLVPFFIDWGKSPHPAETAAPRCQLLELRAEHPEPAGLLRTLRALDLGLRVSPGPRAALVALLQTPTGTVELR